MPLDSEKMQKPVRKLRKLLKKNPKQPTPDQVHDLRTNTRRLEAALTALSLDSQRKEQRLLKDLAKIRKRAGKIRDMDVLTGFASGVHPDGECDCSVQLLEHLGAQRQRHAKKLHSVIDKYGAQTRNGLKKASADLERSLSQNSKDGNQSDASGHALASALKMEEELAAPARLGRNNLHPYRLKVKELHNLLKMTADAGQQEFTEALGKVKDAIGEWHDWEELLAIAKDLLDHGANCKLLRELQRISDQKYQEALTAAENMRRKYLRMRSGQNRRRPPQPAEPVWKATRAIAA
jgi:CHAD domain-containing protein